MNFSTDACLRSKKKLIKKTLFFGSLKIYDCAVQLCAILKCEASKKKSPVYFVVKFSEKLQHLNITLSQHFHCNILDNFMTNNISDVCVRARELMPSCSIPWWICVKRYAQNLSHFSNCIAMLIYTF